MPAETTPNLTLPYIMPSQAQKHVTHNEAIRALDALVQIAAESRTVLVPPAEPQDGVRYIVPEAAEGAWTAHEGAIAAWQDGAWMFHAPKPGWLVWLRDETLLVVFEDGAWRRADAPDEVRRFGINTTADEINRLAVAADATLLTHDGEGHQLKINKAAAADTASLLFQTGWSGRAEMGLAGNDDFEVKVSADGASWTTALAVDSESGAVSFPGSGPASVVKEDDDVDWSGAHVFSQPVKLGASTTPDVPLTVSGSVGGANAAFHVYNTLSANFVGGFQAYAPNLANGQTIYCTLGKQSGLHERASIGYYHAGPASTQNRLTFGFYGADHLMTVLAGGNVGIGVPVPTTKLHVAGPVRVGGFTVAGLPDASAAGAGALVYVSDAAGGPVLACSDGTSWRVAAALGAVVA